MIIEQMEKSIDEETKQTIVRELKVLLQQTVFKPAEQNERVI
jgi:hypothetical protein